jgi:four helix bundle protein
MENDENVERIMPLKTYRELIVWQKAMSLVESIYLMTAEFPNTEKYGLACQLKRAAVSVPSNIAEGYGRTHRGDYLHHLSIAKGSLFEVETQLLLAVRLQLVTRDVLMPIWLHSQEVGKLLTKLIRSLTKRSSKNPGQTPTLNPKP